MKRPESPAADMRFLQGPPGQLAVPPITPDVVLLGLSVDSRPIRLRMGAPIIVVAERSEQERCLRALEQGADDFLLAPLDPIELVTRIRMHVQRVQREKSLRACLRVGPLAIDLERGAVSLRGAPVPVTPAEFRLLAALARRPGETTRREELLEAVHGSLDAAFDRSIDVLVSRLRAKLEVDHRVPSLIRTIRGTGYSLAAD